MVGQGIRAIVGLRKVSYLQFEAGECKTADCQLLVPAQYIQFL